MNAMIVPPGAGTRMTGIRDVTISKLAAAHSRGEIMVAEYEAMPGAGPPLHVHTREDETFWVLEGELWFAAGEARQRATPGTLVFGPRGVAHTFFNRSDAPARMLVIVTPAENFERFYAAATAPGPGGAPPGEAEIAARIGALAGAHGIDILGPNPLA